MKREEMNDLLVINRIAGLLEGLSSIQGAQISKNAAILMEDAAERLMMYVSDEFTRDVSSDEADETEERAHDQ